MSIEDELFTTHRCQEKPSLVSIRRYHAVPHRPWASRGYFDAMEGCYVLAQERYDDCGGDFLDEFGIVSFCPYCGADLRGEEE